MIHEKFGDVIQMLYLCIQMYYKYITTYGNNNRKETCIVQAEV